MKGEKICQSCLAEKAKNSRIGGMTLARRYRRYRIIRHPHPVSIRKTLVEWFGLIFRYLSDDSSEFISQLGSFEVTKKMRLIISNPTVRLAVGIIFVDKGSSMTELTEKQKLKT